LQLQLQQSWFQHETYFQFSSSLIAT